MSQERRWARTARRLGSASIALGVALGLFMMATEGSAHGPTVEITHSEMRPALLNLHVGTTVHFNNLDAMPGGHVVVDQGETFESPPLEKVGDGWHYTFENAGTYEVFIQQHPAAHMRIVVIPKR
jgi:plastocyanin